MTTQQTTWQEYTGSDAQIAEISNCTCWIGKDINGIETDVKWSWQLRKDGYVEIDTDETGQVFTIIKLSHYWIIPADPLREMKIRQAQTGQPVWVRECRSAGVKTRSFVYETTTPDWNIPNAEYSFAPWED